MLRRIFYRGLALATVMSMLAVTVHGCVRVSRSVALARDSEPYRQPAAHANSLRVLVAGDSTAVGTGAHDPRASIAGRIGAAYPGAEIVNVAADGATVGAVAGQIEEAPSGRYDLALIQAGGNDVLRFTSLDRLTVDWRRVLEAAGARAEVVAVMPAGNVGTAPIFFPPLSWVLTARAESAHAVAREAARAADAIFVDLFHAREDDPFLRDPDRYYASDGLHPSAAGYGLWFDTLERAGILKRALGGEPEAPSNLNLPVGSVILQRR